MSKSIKTVTVRKPAKPRPDFPLFPHATGRWAEKFRGRLVHFGKCADDPEGARALEKWLDQKDESLGGRVPRAKQSPEGATVADRWNRFGKSKKLLVPSPAGSLLLQACGCRHPDARATPSATQFRDVGEASHRYRASRQAASVVLRT